MILAAIYYPYSTDDGRLTMMDRVTIHDLTLGTHHIALVPAMQTTLDTDQKARGKQRHLYHLYHFPFHIFVKTLSH